MVTIKVIQRRAVAIRVVRKDSGPIVVIGPYVPKPRIEDNAPDLLLMYQIAKL